MAAKRIGILTSGGDCPGLNAVIRGVVKSCHQLGYDCVGFLKGYEGLYDPVQYVHLTAKSTRGILNQGGTILGSTNKGRFAATVGVSDRKELDPELVTGVKETIEQLGIDGLICVGGDGSLAVAQQLHENGIPVVGVPKTIDNDLSATAFTFGFDSAIECATDALDRLHTTAASHERIMVLEVMGRHAGWIALHSGIAGGGDVILIPEIEWNYEHVCHKILHRESQGKKFTLVVVAEGAELPGGDLVGEHKEGQQMKLGGVGRAVAEEIERRLHRETRLSVLGHLQRGGNPTTFDRVLATQFGAHAVRLVKENRFGEMICSRPPEMTSVPIIEAVNVLRQVDPHGPAVQAARALGISFGDRPADEIGQDVFDKVEMAAPSKPIAAEPTPVVETAPAVAAEPAEEPEIDPVDEIAATAVELTLEVGAAVEAIEAVEEEQEIADVEQEAASETAPEPEAEPQVEAEAPALEVDEEEEVAEETPVEKASLEETPAENTGVETASEADTAEDKDSDTESQAVETSEADSAEREPEPVEESEKVEVAKAELEEHLRERLAESAKEAAAATAQPEAAKAPAEKPADPLADAKAALEAALGGGSV